MSEMAERWGSESEETVERWRSEVDGTVESLNMLQAEKKKELEQTRIKD